MHTSTREQLTLRQRIVELDGAVRRNFDRVGAHLERDLRSPRVIREATREAAR